MFELFIANKNYSTLDSNIFVSNMFLDGASSASRKGVWFRSVRRSKIWNVGINGFRDHGIDVSSATSLEVFTGYCRVQSGAGVASVGYGIRYLGVSDSIILGNEVQHEVDIQGGGKKLGGDFGPQQGTHRGSPHAAVRYPWAQLHGGSICHNAGRLSSPGQHRGRTQ